MDRGQLSPHHPVRPDWLARHAEAVIDPLLDIVDSHHHLWDRPENPYEASDFLRDMEAGHRIVSSIFIECGTRYRADLPTGFEAVGEVAFAASAAQSSGDNASAICAAIVGHADLSHDRLGEILEAEQQVSAGRLRGIRQIAAWHRDPAARASLASPPADRLADKRFLRGVRQLAAHRLSLDVFVYHTQLSELLTLVRQVPDVTFVIDHVGGPIGIGPYTGRRAEVMAAWRNAMDDLASCPNVCVKLTGLGMRLFGFGFATHATPPTSTDLADAWRPYVETCVELFGVDRCMFGSNYPVDKGSCDYVVLWNAFKRITSRLSKEEREALFSGTARRTYRLTH